MLARCRHRTWCESWLLRFFVLLYVGVAHRLTPQPAAFGCALPPLTFSIGKLLGLGNITAFVAGSMIVFDNLNAIESRLILVDSQLMFYCGLALYTALRYWKRRNEVNVTTRTTVYGSFRSSREVRLTCARTLPVASRRACLSELETAQFASSVTRP